MGAGAQDLKRTVLLLRSNGSWLREPVMMVAY
jgi:hypothetical protein